MVGSGYMNNVMNVAFITDKNYVIPTAAAIASLIENNMSFDKLYIYIFCDRVCPDDIEKLKSMKSGNVKINVLEVSVSRYEEAYSELYNRTKIHVSPCAMLKFELPLLLPELDKVLYLDGDIIVNSDLREMYNLDIKDYYLAAVDDIGLMKNEWSEVHRRRLGIENLEYFNSGVMLLNLKKLREEEMTSKLIEYRTEGINDFMDQDAFNMCLGKKRLRLPYEYNFQGKILYEVGFEVVNEILFKNRFQYEDECISEQKILHYSNNKTKPWLFNMYFFTDVFDVYLSKTPYKGHKFYRKRLERVFYEEITKVELPLFIEKLINDELDEDYEYDFFKENPDEVVHHLSVCFNVDELHTLLEVMEKNKKNAEIKSEQIQLL